MKIGRKILLSIILINLISFILILSYQRGIILLFLTSLTLIEIYLIHKLVKTKDKYTFLLCFLPIIIGIKYSYYYYSDYIALLIIPLFIFFFITKVLKKQFENRISTLLSILFLFELLPILGLKPKFLPVVHYIPTEWYMNKYSNFIKIYPVELKSTLKKTTAIKLFKIGEKYEKEGNVNEALNSFKKTLKIEPNSHTTYNSIGILYLENGNHIEAINSFNASIKIKPTNSVYRNLGFTYNQIPNHTLAKENLLKALELDPLSQRTILDLALTESYLKNCENALKLYERAEKINPRSNDLIESIEVIEYYCRE